MTDHSEDARLEEAQRFIEQHGIGELPGARFDNGESADSQRSDFFGGADRAISRTGGSHSKYVRLEPPSDSDEGWEEWMLAEGQNYLPLVGGGTSTLEQLEKRARMRHVLSFMLPMHVELLMSYHVGGRTQEELAEEFGCSQQAVSKRIALAEQDLRRIFGEHWNDDIDWKEQLTERDSEEG